MPPLWSRIMKVDDHVEFPASGFDIEKDMAELNSNAETHSKKKIKNHKPFFDPKSYWNLLDKRDLESNAIGKRKLKAFGKDVSDKRRLFINRAVAVVDQSSDSLVEGLRSADELIKKL